MTTRGVEMDEGWRLTAFAGLPVADFCRLPWADDHTEVTRIDPAYAWRVAVGADDGAAELRGQLERLASLPGARQLRALLVPNRLPPEAGESTLDLIATLADRFPSLSALLLGARYNGPSSADSLRARLHDSGLPNLRDVLGDPLSPADAITGAVSRLHGAIFGDDAPEPTAPRPAYHVHEDVTGLLAAYPRLTVLRVHDVAGPQRHIRHDSLRELHVAATSTDDGTVRDVAQWDLPALERFRLALTTAGTVTVTAADLARVCAGDRLPRLRTLSLSCPEPLDDVVAALAAAPVVPRLSALELLGGMVSDRGAEALLAGQPLAHLDALNLRDNGMSPAAAGRFAAVLSTVDIDVSTEEQRRLEREQMDYDARVAAGEIAVETFGGLPVVDVMVDTGTTPATPVFVPASGNWSVRCPLERLDATRAWRLAAEDFGDPEDFDDVWQVFLATPGVDQVRSLVIGDWGEAFENAAPVADLVALAARCPDLRALYVGDIEGDRCEISWITHDDITPLLRAYPKLEVLRVRGSQGLRLAPVRHEALRELVFECGGLPGDVVRGVAASDLPALAHLELYLGTDRYGADYTIDDLAPILAGNRLPRLTSLGLRDAQDADRVAEALASAPVVARLSTLDLSLGTLSDRGAEALLAGQPLTHLKKLDLHHHFLSDDMAARLVAELPGVEVDVSDRRDPWDGGQRYIAVAE